MRFVVMARVPVPGETKTRLSEGGAGDGAISPETAAAIAAAMLHCTVARLLPLGRVHVAHTPDAGGAELDAALGALRGDVVRQPQGTGDLGTRMAGVWRELGDDTPVAFLGADAPDVPEASLRAIAPAVGRHDVVIGPSDDGGYWTIAASRCHPGLFTGVDWGSPRVYHQSRDRAGTLGLDVGVVPAWQDVDHPADLDRLRRTLSRASNPVGDTTADAALRTLAATLDRLLPPLESLDHD